MSHEKMDIAAAAKFLGVSDRTIRNYIKEGLLATTIRSGDRKKWLDPLEVGELKRDRDELGARAIVSRKEVLSLRAEVRRLRAEMDVVLRMLDTKSNPLHMPPSYAKDLHAACHAQIVQTGWSIEEIEPWTAVFLRIEEEDLQTIKNVTDDPRPWKPYLQLCVNMSVYVASLDAYATSLELQNLHRDLAEGRRRMRVAALIYTEMNEGVHPDLKRYALTDTPKSIRDTLLEITRRKR